MNAIKFIFGRLLCAVIMLFGTTLVDAQTPYVVNESSLNVRSAASPNASILGKVQKGDTVLVINEESHWGKIPFGLKYGYISMSYIEPAEKGNGDTQSLDEKYDTHIKKESIVRSQTQYMPIVDNGNGTYTCNGELMNSWQLQTYLEEKCPVAYNEIINCERAGANCKKAAIILDACIAGPLGAGIYCFVNNIPVAGGVLIGLCGVLATASIPCWVVGAVKSNNAVANGVDVYNTQCSTRYTQNSLEFKLQASSNGIGLAINF